MISNNGYIRGEYAVIGNTAMAGTKLNQYSKEDEYTKHYLTTKEYVDSKVKGNSVFSIKTPYTHTISNEAITAYQANESDTDGKHVAANEVLVQNGNYIVGEGTGIRSYKMVILDNNTGTVGMSIPLELGQQFYCELDKQLYTIVNNEPNGFLLVSEMLSSELTISEGDPSTDIFTDTITYDKLYNNIILHKIQLEQDQTIDFSSTTTHTYSTVTALSDSTNINLYKKNTVNNNAEEVSKQVFSMYSYSGIPNDPTVNWALLFETEPNKYTAMFEDSGNTDIINLAYNSSTPAYTVESSTIESTDKTFILIDYYNHHIVKVVLTSGTLGSPTIDDSNINESNYYKDLSLLVELTITKTISSGTTTYNYIFTAISSPDKQNIIGWSTTDPLIVMSTYKPVN